ncbi:hypothetical protein FRC08_010184 [Ceratobasidium sp. 394]|nr:hypothetical protein FRC08_010184 [Ceratobasidium sp. 394]KAG9085977.1 hypothetical protein FS749_003991 [Ceratobasidium sp. UAMH 11750]
MDEVAYMDNNWLCKAYRINQIKGLSALALHSGALKDANNKRPRRDLFKEIEEGKYTHIFLGPEMIMNTSFGQLLKTDKFRARLRYFAIDEVHLTTEWKRFREEFADISMLRNRFRAGVTWLALSATVEPKREFQALVESLGFQQKTMHTIGLPVDRPSIAYSPRFLQYTCSDSQTEFLDLSFVVPRRASSIEDITITVIFVTKIKVGIAIAEYLTGLLPEEIPAARRRGVVQSVHGQMSAGGNMEAIEALRRGDPTRILVCTDTGALGIDVSQVKRVIVVVDQSTTYRMICQKMGRIRIEGHAVVYLPRWMDMNRTSQNDANARAQAEPVIIDFANASKEKCPRAVNAGYWGDSTASPSTGRPCCNRHNPEIDAADLEEVKARADGGKRGKKRQYTSLRSDRTHAPPDNVVLQPIIRKQIHCWRQSQLPVSVGYGPHLPFSAIIPDHLVNLLAQKLHICSTKERFRELMSAWSNLEELGDSLFELVTWMWDIFESGEAKELVAGIQSRRKVAKESRATNVVEEQELEHDDHVTHPSPKRAKRSKKSDTKLTRSSKKTRGRGGKGR